MLIYYIYSILGFLTIDKYNNVNNIVKIINYIYSFSIFCLLCFNPLFYTLNNTIIGFILYKCNYFIHFCIMYNTIKKIIKYKYFNNIYFNYIILISQLLIVIGYIIFICINSKINTLVIDTNIKLLLYISEFIGIFIYLNSILLFILIFVKTLQEIYIINETIDDNIVNNNKKGLVKFFYNIIDLKNKITYTISDFNYILNIFTIINLFSLGLLYHIYDSLSINQKIYFYILSGYFRINLKSSHQKKTN